MPTSGEPFDFVDAVAKEVPIRVLAQVMGLPADDLDPFIDLGDRLIANTDPEITDVVWGRDDTDAYRRFPFRSPYGKRLRDLGREVVKDWTTSSRSWSWRATRPPGSPSPTACWPSASDRSSGSGCGPTRACSTRPPRR
jgi:cytochrome P450